MKTLLSILVITIAMQCYGQADSTRKKGFGIGLQGSLSYRFLTNASGLNDALGASGLAKVTSPLHSADFGLGIINDRWYFRVAGRVFDNPSDNNNSAKGAGVEFLGQYNLSQTKKIFWGPYLGLTGENFAFIYDTGSPRTLQNALLAPLAIKTTKLTVDNILGAELGLRFFTQRSRGSVQFSSGLEAGYLFTLRGGTYRVNDELVQSPGGNFSGFEAKVSFYIFVFPVVRKP